MYEVLEKMLYIGLWELKKSTPTHPRTHKQFLISTLQMWGSISIHLNLYLWFFDEWKTSIFREVVHGRVSFFFSQLPESNVTELQQKQTWMFSLIFDAVYLTYFITESCFLCFFYFFLSFFFFFKSDVKPPEIPGFQLLIYWAYWGTTMSRSWQLDWRQGKTFIWSTNSIFMASLWICFILCIVLLYPMCLDNCILLDLWFSSTSVSVAAVSCSGW